MLGCIFVSGAALEATWEQLLLLLSDFGKLVGICGTQAVSKMRS